MSGRHVQRSKPPGVAPVARTIKTRLARVDTFGVILLDEALARLHDAARPYGHRRSRLRRSTPPSAIETAKAVILPRRVPEQLLAFWSLTEPNRLDSMFLGGFYSVDAVALTWAHRHPSVPAGLLPILEQDALELWVELESPATLGGRVYASVPGSTVVELWAWDIAGLLDLLADACERDLIDDRLGQLHPGAVRRLAAERLDSTGMRLHDRRIDLGDPEQTPHGWRDHRPVESVADFERRRHSGGGSASATLAGVWRDEISGGPLPGTVGTLTDGSGRVQVYVPRWVCDDVVAHDGRVEIDVAAVETNGIGIDGLSAHLDIQRLVASGVIDVPGELIQRLVEQLADLDTSVVVTAVRYR